VNERGDLVTFNISGKTLIDQAAHVAGALAEDGILSLDLQSPAAGGGPHGVVTLLARQTDLPGELARLGEGQAIAWPGGRVHRQDGPAGPSLVFSGVAYWGQRLCDQPAR